MNSWKLSSFQSAGIKMWKPNFLSELYSLLHFVVGQVSQCRGHYMRDHGWCLTPILQDMRGFLETWPLQFLVIRVGCVSRSNPLKSWILKKSNVWVLSTVINYTHPARAEITGIWQRIECFVFKYRHWVKPEANIPNRLGILRTRISLVSF